MQFEIFRLVSDPGTNILLLTVIFSFILLFFAAIAWRKERPSGMRLLLMVFGSILFSLGLGIMLPYMDSPPGPGMPIGDMVAGGAVIAIVGLVILVGIWCSSGSIVKAEISSQKTGSVRIRTIEQVTEAANQRGLLVSSGNPPIIRCPKCDETFTLVPEMLVASDLQCIHCGKQIGL